MAINTKAALPQGTKLQGGIGIYEIIQPLGQGAFGITYLAKINIQTQLGNISTNVALKEFFMGDINGREGYIVTNGSNFGLFSKYKEKFVKEAINLSQHKHQNIVKVYETFEANNTVYYSMEYIEGGSLDSYIAQKGKLGEEETLAFTTQIVSALKEMHRKNMLHLDLKPGNVMLKDGKTAVLIDFGLSKQYDNDGNPESSTTIGGGTPGYAPLEQTNYSGDISNGLPVTMDIYALGGTMFKMLTGHRPPDASTILNDGFPSQGLDAENISQSTKRLLLKAMEPIRKNRLQSIGAFEGLMQSHLPILSDEKTQIDSAPIKDFGCHEWVDLGLPSGLKWASCNVGASKPEDYGDYFAWGETKPKGTYYEENSETYRKTIATLRECGYIDAMGNLTKAHDAASVNWGSKWRMPTEAEIDELIENTTIKWITLKNVKGCLVVSKRNGNSIFIPAAGYRYGSSLRYTYGGGFCWISSTYEDCVSVDLDFDSSSFCKGSSCRYYGRSVRPVSDK